MDSLQARIEALPRELRHQPTLQKLQEKAVEATCLLEKTVTDSEKLVSLWPEISNRFNSTLDRYFQIPFGVIGTKRILKETTQFPKSRDPQDIQLELDKLQNLVSECESKMKKRRKK